MERAGNVYVVEPEEGYKKVNKSIIECKYIDCETLGVYVRIITLGLKWRLNIKGLAAFLGLSDNKIRKAIKSLEEQGYIVRKAVSCDDGKLRGWDYYIYPYPIEEEQRSRAGLPCYQKTDTRLNRQHGLPTTRFTDNTVNGEDNNNILKELIDLNNNKTESIITVPTTKKERFVKPTLEEVEAYISEKGYCVNAQQFIDYYTSNGWKVGRNPMKDWKAAVRTWETKERRQYGQNRRYNTDTRTREERRAEFIQGIAAHLEAGNSGPVQDGRGDTLPF